MAIEAGVNYLDTAVPYHMGASEPFLSRALTGGYREKVKLATKLPRWSVKVTDDMDKLLTKKGEIVLHHAGGGGADTPGRASQCESCGQCEEACPQALPIQSLLKEVASEMEGPFFDAKVWVYRKFTAFQRWQVFRRSTEG
jgi:predicted aldo/keto reductase-like oxidoreductase